MARAVVTTFWFSLLNVLQFVNVIASIEQLAITNAFRVDVELLFHQAVNKLEYKTDLGYIHLPTMTIPDPEHTKVPN